ncbi:MAG: 30S ribosomal protein S20 [Candidatus Izemoplasmatales bacterium]|jgi:small subunit ribosomal protein S20|nr:30S ribosomal protein S20 [Candidatus Izemoplasmatales bacterium]
MANIKQQKKRILTNEKHRLANASFSSSLKTAIKDVETCVKNGDKEKAVTALNLAFMKIDKSVSKGIHHKNYASKKKSSLSKLVNTI